VELVVPGSSRAEPQECIPLGPFVFAGRDGGDERWTAPLPIRTRSMFFFTAPADMTVHRGAEGDEVPHARQAGRREARWTYDDRLLVWEQPVGEPSPAGACLRYPRAIERERSMNLDFASQDGSPRDLATRRRFVTQRALSGPQSWGGLLLPAPAHATWRLTVPPAAELRMDAGIAPPEVADVPASDGALLRVEVDGAEVASFALEPDHFAPIRLDLARFAGQEVQLTLRVDPAGSASADYALLADPVLASRKAAPQRAVLVFIDTVRADHLGAYGYKRPTSPHLDALAERGVLFEQARSVAPWTLPTTRSVMTGLHPERWGGEGRPEAPTLQGALRERGWATAMIAGNVYLGSNFGIDRDWALHDNRKWPRAPEQVERGLAWLNAQEGRDALLMLHFMDAHLPYLEPASHRRIFAGDAPEALGETFHRHGILKVEDQPGVREHVVDRYDNNLRVIDDALATLFDALPDDAVVVVFADHGEEFWDHGGFEHGHSLHDELLRVPLIVRAPGFAPARVAAPVSLLDLAPTVLELVGHPGALATNGRSLAPAMRGEPAALSALEDRPLAFGRPLYGAVRWGVVADGHKLTTHELRESLFDLRADPGERNDLLTGAPYDPASPWREVLGDALPGEVHRALRLDLPTARAAPDHDLVARVHVPGGIAAAWSADDPLQNSHVTVTFEGETAEITWHEGWKGGREAFVVPVDPEAAKAGVSVRARSGKTERAWQAGPHEAERPAQGELWREKIGERTLELGWATARAPGAEELGLKGADDELTDALKALGYSED
jgi:arylsulfatase A-like enzyme